MDKKEVLRFQRIKRVYGLTKDQYEKLNSGACPICLRTFDDNIRPCIDHDHVTGAIRGVVCLYCNHRLIGRHRDGSLVRRIADYLDSPRPGWVVPKKKRKKKCKKKTKMSTTTKTSPKTRSRSTRKSKSVSST